MLEENVGSRGVGVENSPDVVQPDVSSGNLTSELANPDSPGSEWPVTLREVSRATDKVSEWHELFERNFIDRVDGVRDSIRSTVNNPQKAVTFLDLLEKAQNLFGQGSEYYEEAERLLSEVEYYLAFMERVRRASQRVGFPLFLYEIFWFSVLAWGVLQINLAPTYEVIRNASPIAEVNLVHLLSSLIWGGLGGVVGALYALWKHVAKEQDFDPQYTMWYLTNPVLGVMLGGFVFLVIQAGFFSLTAGIEPGFNIRSAFVIYVLAWISGFKQNVVYEIVRRILDVFRVETPVQTSGVSTGGEAERS
ncbi:hypothetical protein [uncultured Thermanaerothrix sp.]|uniref:hypothetical protein n=1 Tax=uncultured Thermanaerothrix sp. TaxID=1195149 RepID=UPI00260E9286|nr:hypothetical protein [uncultured Thermanaerothrix sp.]